MVLSSLPQSVVSVHIILLLLHGVWHLEPFRVDQSISCDQRELISHALLKHIKNMTYVVMYVILNNIPANIQDIGNAS